EKTAAALLARYGSLARVLAARDEGDPGLTATQRRRLTEAAGYLEVAPLVVQVARDAPVGEVCDALPAGPADPDALADLAERWNLGSSVQRLLDALRGWLGSAAVRRVVAGRVVEVCHDPAPRPSLLPRARVTHHARASSCR